MLYFDDLIACPCCRRRIERGVCRCVWGNCRRCLLCLTHCECPEKQAREAAAAEGLDDPDGPFVVDLSGKG